RRTHGPQKIVDRFGFNKMKKKKKRRFRHMYKVTRLVPKLFTFVLLLAVGMCLAAVPAAKDSTTKNTTTSMKAKPSATKTTARSMAKSSARETQLASAEDLSGTISMVDPTDKEVTLIGSNGVPYDFRVTTKTLVELSNNKIGADELTTEDHKQATVHFVPMSNGNLAQKIQISAS
ncbi:MAG: hypothetical protein WA424_03005, partial [Candidatus Sulfotelmatobacter sp.]